MARKPPKPPQLPPDPRYAPLRLLKRLVAETGRRYAGRYAVALVLLAVVAAATGISAWLMKDVVNKVFVDHDETMLWLLGGVIVAVSVVKGLATYQSTVELSRIGNGIVARIQRRLFEHVIRLGADFHARTRSSEIVTRMTHNANAAREVLNTIVTSFGRDLLSVIGLVAVMVLQAPLLSAMVLVIGPAIILSVNRLVKRIRTIARHSFDSATRLTGVTQETAQGIRTVQAFGLEAAMTERMDEAVADAEARANKMARVGARTGPLMETLGGIAVAAVITWGGYSVIYLGQQPGAFISFITALLLAYEPAKRLARTHLQVEAGLVGVRLMYELLDTPPTIAANPDGPELTVTAGEVRLEGVRFRYRAERPVFDGLDFRAAPGQTTALVGPSGAGKTTLINLIERFFEPEAGRVLIDGQDIAAAELGSLRRQLALVSQDVFLFSGTVAENIAFGRPGAARAEIEAAARGALAHDFIMALPDGYDTPVGEHGAQLSGGQRQRIAIARAMLRDAPVVLLDEATSALDAESESLVQAAFERLMEGRTTIVIAHRLATVINADRICVLVDGKVVEEGRHAELLARGEHYARLYRLQFEPEARQRGKVALSA